MKKGVLLATAGPSRKKGVPTDPQYQRKLRLPPREPRPTFTTMELSSLPELRETLGSWFDEFKDDGPHEGDVSALERYFRRVLVEERDVSKVVSIIKWLEWLLDEAEDVWRNKALYDRDDVNDTNEGLRAWNLALNGMKERIQEAIVERGLGRIDL